MIRTRLWLALALVAAGPAQAGPAPAIGYSTRHPYISALDGLSNYQSCGARARAAALAPLDRAFRESEAAARAKGLAPLLDALRRDYLALLAVSSRMACARGPAAALAAARASVRAFQAWVAARPPPR